MRYGIDLETQIRFWHLVEERVWISSLGNGSNAPKNNKNLKSMNYYFSYFLKMSTDFMNNHYL
jgi:hypothetical protein